MVFVIKDRLLVIQMQFKYISTNCNVLTCSISYFFFNERFSEFNFFDVILKIFFLADFSF